MKKRWVLLEHRSSRYSLNEIHFDLLLEEEHDCRTWRLEDLPKCDGPPVEALASPPHNLYWLERKESVVSGGRGWAKRVEGGIFIGCLPLRGHQSQIAVELVGDSISGVLEIKNNLCNLVSLEKFNCI
ncbi:hypothetical protein [Prochlorococcus marinus]|uniref:Uncharacterized protein n=1 Tax=Prochlorococcus marinus (strain MIT 9211) TaxID=93059 RepID=A9B9B8_PROM4|nr:hypothetical protein [Prochlorococcus marinus]ABX07995.1 conserved hypothetical protein [Prochlorococcus marinus str. MIT 9211]